MKECADVQGFGRQNFDYLECNRIVLAAFQKDVPGTVPDWHDRELLVLGLDDFDVHCGGFWI